MADRHLLGRDVKWIYFLNNVQVSFRFKDIDAEEVAEEIDDDVCGEDRSRSQIVVKYWTVSLNGYMPDTAMLDATLLDIANTDTGLVSLNKSLAVSFRLDNGKRVTYVGKEITRKPYKLNVGGANQSNMQSVGFKCRYFDKK